MELPEELETTLRAVREAGRPFLVGGCVRDWLAGLPPKDFDIEVFDTTYEELRRVLASFGPTDVVGKSFGVVKVRLGREEYDFSLPRRERKAGRGHRGFEVEADASLTFAEAAARRDFTINAVGYDWENRCIIDPYAGASDMRERRLRHVGPAFAEDPLRVMRAFQFAARFDLEIAPETADLSRSIKNSFAELPRERIWGEWDKWARLAVRPSRGIEVLEKTGWIEFFPPLPAMRDCPQDPEWHPEGDVLQHTMHCLDALAALPGWQSRPGDDRRLLMFAVLLHDFGKTATTQQAERHGATRWISPGHDRAGGEMTVPFLERIGAPKNLAEKVRPLVENHMIHLQASARIGATAIRRLARRLEPATIEELALVMTADTRGRPPLPERDHPGVDALLEGARLLKLEKQAPRPIILGRHLIQLGLTPDPSFKEILETMFEMQLAGQFDEEEAGLRLLARHLKRIGRLPESSR